MSAHTPGPWTVYPETDGTEICAVTHDPGLPIRQLIAHPVRGDNWIANARLIAAAPELYEALEPFAELVRHADEFGHEPGSTCLYRLSTDDIRRAAAALAKARGES